MVGTLGSSKVEGLDALIDLLGFHRVLYNIYIYMIFVYRGIDGGFVGSYRVL
jgi:hypothetical protein